MFCTKQLSAPECGSGGLTENCKQREGERGMSVRGLRNNGRERGLCEETRRDDLVTTFPIAPIANPRRPHPTLLKVDIAQHAKVVGCSPQGVTRWALHGGCTTVRKEAKNVLEQAEASEATGAI